MHTVGEVVGGGPGYCPLDGLGLGRAVPHRSAGTSPAAPHPRATANSQLSPGVKSCDNKLHSLPDSYSTPVFSYAVRGRLLAISPDDYDDVEQFLAAARHRHRTTTLGLLLMTLATISGLTALLGTLTGRT